MGSAAAECEEALDKPALKASWEKIQAIAKDNARIFDAVFNFIPRNMPKPEKGTGENYSDDNRPAQEDGDVPASIWPVMKANQKNSLSNRENMPFSEIFWLSYKKNIFLNRYRLDEIKGYFATLSTGWTTGEDNLIPYNMRLIAQRDDSGCNEQKITMNEIVESEERLS